MSSRPTDAKITAFAVALLAAGILPSAIPGRLMDEFGLSAEKAGELAGRAVERRRIETLRQAQEGPQNVEKPGD